MSPPGVVVDTSALLAYADSAEPDHEEVRRAIERSAGPFVLSPFVIAEVDYLVASRHGVTAELARLRELHGGAWDIATVTQDDLRRAADVIERYADQEIGVADASLVVLADRFRTRTIATLDRRHFSVLRPLSGGRFRLLP